MRRVGAEEDPAEKQSASNSLSLCVHPSPVLSPWAVPKAKTKQHSFKGLETVGSSLTALPAVGSSIAVTLPASHSTVP